MRTNRALQLRHCENLPRGVQGGRREPCPPRPPRPKGHGGPSRCAGSGCPPSVTLGAGRFSLGARPALECTCKNNQRRHNAARVWSSRSLAAAGFGGRRRLRRPTPEPNARGEKLANTAESASPPPRPRVFKPCLHLRSCTCRRERSRREHANRRASGALVLAAQNASSPCPASQRLRRICSTTRGTERQPQRARYNGIQSSNSKV
jgi:hypothetical protein